MIVADRPKFRLKRPTVPEADIVRGVLQLLAVHPRVAWAGRMNSGAMAIGEPGKQRYVRFNSVAGLSDVIGQLKGGRLIAVECKRQGQKATPEQQSFLDMVSRHGGLALVAYSTDDVASALQWTTPIEQAAIPRAPQRVLDGVPF